MSRDDLLDLPDLTTHEPGSKAHAVELVTDAIEGALAAAWTVPVRRDPGPRIVSVADNYDRLRYSADAVTRNRRYSHYLGNGQMLRSHTTAWIPVLLDGLGRSPAWLETLLSVPGICYRRDVIDRRHVGNPHQLDLWRIRRSGAALTLDDLDRMVGAVIAAVLPGARWYTQPNTHPYTVAGREIYADAGTGPVEIGECGLAHPEVLAGSGLPPTASGLAMGLGLDRIVMLVKGIDDIRLLRSRDPRVATQMRDLEPYRPVSAMPAARRDLSLAVSADLDAERVGDRVRELLGADSSAVEEVRLVSATAYADLPDSARVRMGVRPGQQNILVRVILRDLDSTLTADRANELRDRIYAGLHDGGRHEWSLAGGLRPGA